MARFQRRSFRSQSQSQRRKTDWIGGVQTGVTSRQSIGAATSAIIASLDTRVAGPPFAPFTILRLRGQFRINTDQKSAQEAPFGAIGAMVVNGEAFDAGIASIPTPWTESFDDRWYWHQYWSTQFDVTSSTGMYSNADVHDIDNKAMRKVEVGDVIVWVIQNQNSTQAAAFQFNVRTLVKLH